MGANVSLTPAVQSVMPGQSASYELRVRNTGSVVDEFTFEPLGDAAGWIRVDPPVLPLFPGTEEVVRVTVTPPNVATTPAGVMPFAVRAVSREDPAGSAVAEAGVDVGAFAELFAELVPRTARGRRKGTTDLAIDNRGNDPADLALTGLDSDGNVVITVEPPAVTTDPGTATFADVTVKPKKSFWRGPSKTLPFQVVASRDGEDAEPLVVDGTMVQEAIFPKWLLRALLLLLLLCLLAIPAWFLLLKPSVESTAKDAAAEEVEEQLAELEEASPAGAAAEEAAAAAEEAGAAQSAAEEAATNAQTAVEEIEGGGGVQALGDPTALRLSVSAPVGGTQTDPFTVPAGQVFRLTDIVLQNPQGDSGRIEVRRDGDVLLALALQNFRDIDYHFVAPILFTEGQVLDLNLTSCDAVIAPATECNSSGSFVGFIGAQS